MKRTKGICLGISPGTRYIGIAVMKERELIDYKMKTFKGKWSKEKLDKIRRAIIKIIEHYQISKIAMKVPHEARSSKALNDVVKTIEMIAKRMKISVKLYDIKRIEKTICKGQKTNIKELMKLIAEEYTILQPELLIAQKTNGKYYQKIFEAVGLGNM